MPQRWKRCLSSKCHQEDVTISPMIMKATTKLGKNQKEAEMREESIEAI